MKGLKEGPLISKGPPLHAMVQVIISTTVTGAVVIQGVSGALNLDPIKPEYASLPDLIDFVFSIPEPSQL